MKNTVLRVTLKQHTHILPLCTDRAGWIHLGLYTCVRCPSTNLVCNAPGQVWLSSAAPDSSPNAARNRNCVFLVHKKLTVIHRFRKLFLNLQIWTISLPT